MTKLVINSRFDPFQGFQHVSKTLQYPGALRALKPLVLLRAAKYELDSQAAKVERVDSRMPKAQVWHLEMMEDIIQLRSWNNSSTFFLVAVSRYWVWCGSKTIKKSRERERSDMRQRRLAAFCICQIIAQFSTSGHISLNNLDIEP